MNYEQKYKQKYKQALERAMKLALTGNVSALAAGEIFPELKESEGEMIRKDIISYLRNEKIVKRYISDIEFDKWIAWLEKQKLNTSKREIDDAYLQGICDAKHEIEKQGEQPTDKIEPKFKVRDWITDDDYDGDYTWKIVEVKPLDYILQSQDGNIVDDTISYVDEHFHLWTIQDAKDGDVLVTTSARNCPFIYRKTDHNNNLAYFYAGINGNGNFCEGCIKRTLYHFGSASNVAPATKEQRELLFQKMKEAGYEWDTEKKELKKIELKTLNADEVIAWLEKHIIEWKGQDLIKTFTPNSPAGKSYIVEQFKEDFGL